MKKRILALVLIMCMVLPVLPLTAIAASVSVDGLWYDSPYARDVVFGDVPVSSWYTCLVGTENSADKNFGLETDYEAYMTAFDQMVGFGDIAISAGTVQSNGYDAEGWYNDLPADVVNAMNKATASGYITREIIGKACATMVGELPTDAAGNYDVSGDTVLTRTTQYMYAYEFDPTKEAGYTGPDNLPKIIIMTGNQSDEKGAIFGTYYFLYDMLYNTESNPVLEYLRYNVKLVVMPCLSPGGINQNTYWNANYVNVNRNFDSNFSVAMTNTGDNRYQNTGYAAFDQSENCAARDLINEHSDAFYFADFHTNTSMAIPMKDGEPDWESMNWLSMADSDDPYYQKLYHAADWHIDRVTEQFFEEYDLAAYGALRDEKCSNLTKTKDTQGNNGTSGKWVRSLNIMGTTLEGMSGFPRTATYPDGILGGRYSFACQKADSEILGNWLIAVLGEYAYLGELPTSVYETVTGAEAAVSATHTGRKADLQGTLTYDVIPFLTWSASTPAAGTTATVNPTLVGTWIQPTDTWEQAIEGYKNYLMSLPKVTTDTGWVAMAYETEGNPSQAGTVASPITRFSIFLNSNIFGVTIGGTVHSFMPSTNGEQALVSENYYKAQVDKFTSYAALVAPSGTVENISLSYDTDIQPLLTDKKLSHLVRPWYNSVIGNATAAIFYNGYVLRPHFNGSSVGMSYTIPADIEVGTAELTISSVSITDTTNSFEFNVYKNGTALLSANVTTTGATVEADIAEAFASLGALSVVSGDVIELRFKRNGARVACMPALQINVTPDTESSESWSGTDAAVTYQNVAAYHNLFRWYNVGADGIAGTADDVRVTHAGIVEDTAYAIINPDLIGSGRVLTGNETYGEAVAKYKDYLRTRGRIISNGNWQLGALGTKGDPYRVSGTEFLSVSYYNYLARHNIYGLMVADATFVYTDKYREDYADYTARGITDEYFEEILSIYCMDYTWVKENGVWVKKTDLSVIDSNTKITDIAVSTLTYADIKAKHADLPTGAVYAWDTTSNNREVNRPTDQQTRKIFFRPGGNSAAAALGYTVPSGFSGTAKLTLNSLTYAALSSANTFEWSVAVNGGTVIGWTQYTPSVTSDDLVEEALTAINTKLAAANMIVEGGDVITFAVRRCISAGEKSIEVSPAITVNLSSVTTRVLQTVTFASGTTKLASKNAVAGESIADLIAEYRKTDSDFAANGCYVNGTWYAAGVTLPTVPVGGVVIDELNIATAASMTIGATYTVNVTVEAPATATEAGIYIGSQKVAGTWDAANSNFDVAAKEVYAKDLLDAKFVYTPYYVVGGTEYKAHRYITVRAKDLLNTYITGDYGAKVKNLAAAALDYAATAKAYFGAKEFDADLVAKLAGYDTAIAADTAPMTNIAEVGATYEFYAATLQIDETVSFVLAIRGNGVWDLDPNSILNLNGHAVTPTTYATSWIGNEKVLILSVGNVPEAEFANDQVFTLTVDGGLQSTLTYSVNAYCNRNLTKAADAEANMIRAIYAIGQAAKAYNA